MAHAYAFRIEFNSQSLYNVDRLYEIEYCNTVRSESYVKERDSEREIVEIDTYIDVTRTNCSLLTTSYVMLATFQIVGYSERRALELGPQH